MEKLTVNVREMAEMLGIGKPKAYELCNRADFPTVRIGTKIIIPVDALKVWLQQQVS